MASMRLRTFGRIDLTGRDASVLDPVLAQPKRLALLVYLLVARPAGFKRRDTLLALFWPDATEDRARASLSQALTFLRRGLGESAVVTRGVDEVRIDPELVWCDAAEFESLLDAGSDARALALYEGDFLAALHVSDLPDAESWIDTERGRLRSRALTAATRLADGAASANDYAAALRWSEQAFALAGDDERVLRRLMEAHDRAGNRAGALRVYEDFATRLRSEHDAVPAGETSALAARLAAQRLTRPVASSAWAPAMVATAGESAASFPNPASEVTASRPSSPSRATRPFLLGVAVVTLGLVIAAAAATRSVDRADPKAPAIVPKRIMVIPLEDRTRDSSLAAFGDITADWVTEGLTRTGLVDVVDARVARLSALRVDTAAPHRFGDTRVQSIGEQAGAGLLVSGAYSKVGDSLYVHVTITDAASGRVLKTVAPVGSLTSQPTAVLSELRTRIMGALSAVLDPRLATLTGNAGAPPTYEAYVDYVRGLDHFSNQQYNAALPLFERAAARDTTFVLPQFWAAFAYSNTGRMAKSDSIVQLIVPRRHSLSTLDQYGLEYFQARSRGDQTAVIRALRRASALAPQSNWTFMLGAQLHRINRHREAVEVLTSLDPERGWIRGWRAYWQELSTSYHALGEHESALEVARRARRAYPELPILRGLEMMALAALGRVREVDEIVDAAIAADRPTARAAPPPEEFMAAAGNELYVHGHAKEARRLANRCSEWSRANIASAKGNRERASSLNRWASCAYLADSTREAQRLYEELLAVSGSDSLAQFARYRRIAYSRLGVIAARAGDRARALQYVDSLAGMVVAADPVVGVVDQAYITAALGDRKQTVALLRRLEAAGSPSWLLTHEADFGLIRGLYPPFDEAVQPQGERGWNRLWRQVKQLSAR